MAIRTTITSLLSLTISLHCTPSFSKVVTLGTPGKELEFQRFVNSYSNKKSLKNTIIQTEFDKSKRLIKDKYELAVKGLLLDDLKPSIFVLKEITNFSETLIFPEESKRFISESFFRLANLERVKSNFWIKQGVFFDLSFKPSKELFNPNIVKDFNQQNEKIQNFTFTQKKSTVADDSTSLFLNGNLSSEILTLHPSHVYQLKLFKEGYKLKSLEVSGEDFLKIKKIKLEKLNLGSCANPNFIKYKNIQIDEIYFSKNCIKSRNESLGLVVAKNDTLKRIKKNTKNKGFKKDFAQQSPKKKTLFQKPSTWYVIGGTVLATALILALNSDNGPPKVVPVDR